MENTERQIEILDTTLRDGGQGRGITFSVNDKLRISERLDRFGMHYIEGGWPGLNKTDSEFFEASKGIQFKNAKLVAFGMTCAKGKRPEDDHQLAKLLDAETGIIAIVGKTSEPQVRETLGISFEENLRIIKQSCRFLVENGREVFFDAEHFFDGFKASCIYSLACIAAAVEGGASRIILCDTNGGGLPSEVGAIVSLVKKDISVPIGIHAHNDSGVAVANSLIAVEAGAYQVQGTINGYGERCGNANLCSVVPSLKIKMGLNCIPDENISQITNLARFVAEIANLPFDHKQAYVGSDAFGHKAGLHASAISKCPGSYNHINPELVGNTSSVSVSELSGRSNVLIKAKEFGINLSLEQIKKVLSQVETLENKGFQFEGVDGSLKLMMLRQLDSYAQPFEVLSRQVSSRQVGSNDPVDSATVKLKIKNGKEEEMLCGADGDGPVNALDIALRKALVPHFPYL